MLGVLALDVSPFPRSAAQVVNHVADFADGQPDLDHCVSLPKSNTIISQAVEVDRHGERNTKLIVTRISLTQRGVAVVQRAGVAKRADPSSDLSAQFWIRLALRNALILRQNRQLVRRDNGCEREYATCLLFILSFLR